MSVGALAILSAAVLAVPEGRGGLGLRRLPGHVGRDRRGAVLAAVAALDRVRAAAAGAVLVGGIAVGMTGVVTAVLLAAGAGALTAGGWTALAARRRQRMTAAGREIVSALTAELRAGTSPARCLSVVAASGVTPLHTRLEVAARAATLGGDVPRALREGSTDADALDRLAAGWELSSHTGCSLATVLDAVDQELRAEGEHRRLVTELMAGPRATALLLACLPMLGLAMGAALGAAPWHVLTHTAPGQVALAAGVGLDAVGLLWTVRLTCGAAAS